MITSLIFQNTNTGNIEIHYLSYTLKSELNKYIGNMKNAGFQLLSKYKQESANNGNN